MRYEQFQHFQAFFAIFSFLSLASSLAKADPIIGIISSLDSRLNAPESGIKTTYAEFAEAGGAKVIPIPWDIDEEKFNILLESVNGILFAGGDAKLWEEEEATGQRTHSIFQKRLNHVVNFVIQKKKQDIHYPLWAICQGFEAVAIALTGDLHIVDSYVHFGKRAEVYFTPGANMSTMFQYYTQASFDFLRDNPAMYYYHEYALNTSVPSLYATFGPDKWSVTGISKDDNSKEFLAAMESKEYPIFMTMYHEERAIWAGNHLPGDYPPEAIIATNLLAKSFINEAAKNGNKFQNKELEDALIIQNFPVTDKGDDGFYYVFHQDSLDEKWDKALRSCDAQKFTAFPI